MGATLDALLALREIELQISDIRRQLAAKERSVARQSDRLRAAQDALEAGRAGLRQTQVAADAADLDVKSRDASVNKLRDNLNTVRTNKEYAAILSRLNNEKADRSRSEARALELMQDVEGRRKQADDCEKVVADETRRLETLQAQLQQAQGSFKERLAALERERAVAAERIEAKTIEMFNRLSERYDGEVMARVVQVHPRRLEYICEGCNMSINVERANALLTKDEVQTCGSCGRILFIEKSH